MATVGWVEFWIMRDSDLAILAIPVSSTVWCEHP
jgi:hypothetical protein